jgi:hypothetical protein
MKMPSTLAPIVVIAALGLSAPPAKAGPCLEGMIVGGILGHHVHHTFIGAAAGCFAGKMMHYKWETYKVNHPDVSAQSYMLANKDDFMSYVNKYNTEHGSAPQN